jgi:hypothetical protein
MTIAYPLYLDVPMLVSLLASGDEGLTPDAGLASLGIDLEGRVGAAAERTTENALRQRHTVGSLFNRFRSEQASNIKAISSSKDLTAVEHGDFVELTGSLVRNPIYEFITVMERLFALSTNDVARSSASAAGVDLIVPEETRQVFLALRQELDSSPVVDATMSLEGATGIISLRRGFLSHESLDDLRFGTVRILGKAVGTLGKKDSWHVLGRSLVGHLVSGAFTDAVGGLQDINPDGEFPVQTVIDGPGVFVIPLAVFV